MSTPLEIVLQDGVTAVIYRPSSETVTVIPSGTPVSGLDGTDGVDGKSLLSITDESQLVTGFGNDGDYAVLKVGSVGVTFYGPKAAGAWPLPGIALGGAGSGGSSLIPTFMHMGG